MMQHDGSFVPNGLPSGEAITVVFMASSWTEAVVVRGLLDSSGIPSPALGDGYPPDMAPLFCNIEIYALESQAERARQVIAEYLASAEEFPEEDEFGAEQSNEP
jgi:hypothetical protein